MSPEIKRLQEQIQMLHERIEILEKVNMANDSARLMALQNDILNIKLVLKEYGDLRDNSQ